jgi:excinuclease ABC subunit C
MIDISPEMAARLEGLPDQPGVYLMKDSRGRVLYVGKASSLRSRVRSYFQESADHSARIRWMVSRVADVETVLVDSEIEALILECTLIKRHRPYFNVKYRDDKRYLLLEVTTGETWPRLRLVRRRQNPKSRYFGPFPDAGAVRLTMKVLQGVFQVRTCKGDLARELPRPCLDYYIKLCTAPCTRLVSPEEYRQQVEDALDFLEGRSARLVHRLREEMARQMEALNFERCARLRDMLADLEKVSERQKMVLDSPEDEDYVALASEGLAACAVVLQVRQGKLWGQGHFFLDSRGGAAPPEALGAFLKQYYQDATPPPRILVSDEPEDADLVARWLSQRSGRRVEVRRPRRGDRRQLLELAGRNARQRLAEESHRAVRPEARDAALDELQKALGLAEAPWRIEGVDISNLHGKQAVGSLVVFEHGLPRRSHYRHFKIQGPDRPDDYRMMREVLGRRFRPRHEGDRFSPLPDLLVVDGGKGQLGVAAQVLEELGLAGRVSLAALAKENEWLFVPGASDPVVLPAESGALLLLRHLRDEAHRFALSYHRKLRGKTVRGSVLDGAPGIGPARKKALLKHFGSADRLLAASPEELARVEGMGPALARRLHQFLHSGAARHSRSIRTG